MALLDTCGVAPPQGAADAAADSLQQQAITTRIRKTLTGLPNVPVSGALLAANKPASGPALVS